MKKKISKTMLKRGLLALLIIVTSYLFIVVGTLYGFIFKNKLSVPTGCILPYIDPDTLQGVAINCILQSFAVVCGGLGMIGVEVFINICDTTVALMTELTVYHMQKFNENIQTGNIFTSELINIFKMLDDLKAYIEYFNVILYWKTLLQPTFTKITVALCIFTQYTVIVVNFLILFS